MPLRRFKALLTARLRGFPPAYRELLVVEVFSGDRIGAAGRTPSHLTAWRDLLAHESATSCFQALVANATLPGQLYGLAGLYFKDPTRLKTLVTPYLSREDSVPAIVACFVGQMAVREIVERILDGAWPEALRRGASGIVPLQWFHGTRHESSAE